MRKIIFGFAILISLAVIGSCAHQPKCGNPPGAHTIYMDAQNGCEPRIKQVTIASELNIPASLKDPKVFTYDVEWIDAAMIDGRIVLGHFVLTPKKVEVAP